MKNQSFYEEAQHLKEVQSMLDQKILDEATRKEDTSLDEHRKDSVSLMVKQLEALKEAPYFGRIDIQMEAQEEGEKLYIGPATFFDSQDQVQIYDWRAPIASLFYEGTLGDLTYETPNGIQKAHAQLKRNLVIKKGQLESVYDLENEESLLMDTLNAPTNRDGHLEGITATIQKEQNEIIRHLQKDWLIVNGCAGSGKTTILLQRIAYLMYQTKNQRANDMLLLSRNHIFAKYISQVIPSLTGSDLYQQTVSQHTVQLFKDMHLNKQATIVASPNRKIYLTDAAWVELLHPLIQQLSLGDLVYRSLGLKGVRIYGSKDYDKLIDQINPKLSLYQQLTQIQDSLLRHLKRRLNKFYLSQKAKDIYENMTAMQIESLMKEKEFSSDQEYYQALGALVFEKDVQVLTQQIEAFAFLDFTSLLAKWLPLAKQKRAQLGRNDNAALPVKVAEGKYQLTAEGVRVLLYVATSIAPIRAYQSYSHLFIDEVQDVSLLLMAALSNYYFRAKFTVVGDTFQSFTTATSIFSLEDRHPDLVGAFFKDRVLEKRHLAISYRCTAQITRFANGLLSWPLEKNVFPRTGQVPSVMTGDLVTNRKQLQALMDQTSDKIHTTAILCRTMDQAKALAQDLGDELVVLEDSSESLGARFVVSTIDVVKGLEFDQVIIWQANQEAYASQKEQMMLYTSCTRAKHLLTLIGQEETLTTFVTQSQAPMTWIKE